MVALTPSQILVSCRWPHRRGYWPYTSFPFSEPRFAAIVRHPGEMAGNTWPHTFTFKGQPLGFRNSFIICPQSSWKVLLLVLCCFLEITPASYSYWFVKMTSHFPLLPVCTRPCRFFFFFVLFFLRSHLWSFRYKEMDQSSSVRFSSSQVSLVCVLSEHQTINSYSRPTKDE